MQTAPSRCANTVAEGPKRHSPTTSQTATHMGLQSRVAVKELHVQPTTTEEEIATRRDLVEQIRRRKQAAAELRPMRCGHHDPLYCTDECGRYWRRSA